MGYAHINNLYKAPTFLEKAGSPVYALEKIHGSSAHVAVTFDRSDTTRAKGMSPDGTWQVHRHAGGQSDVNFAKCIPTPALMFPLTDLLINTKIEKLMVFGEVYGGKCQKMSATYGPELKFVGFDVEVDGKWLTVPEAEEFCKKLGIEFVHYEVVDNTLDALNKQRDADSVQAIRNGMGPGKIREGIVIKPLVEMVNEFGERLMVKHKRDEFKETATPRTVETDPAKLQVLHDAEAIAVEWVVEERLNHVLDKLVAAGVPMEMPSTPKVMKAMVEDVKREAEGEITWSPEAEKAIGKRATALFKAKVMAVKHGE